MLVLYCSRSENQIKFFLYLKLGNGEPWAGQLRAIGFLAILSKRLNLVSDENFGFAPEIGSEKIANEETLT